MTSIAWKLAEALTATYGIHTKAESELAEFLMEHGITDLEQRLMGAEAELHLVKIQRDEYKRAAKGKP